MEYGIKANAGEADKIVGKLRLGAGETAMFVGTCSNWAPIAVDRIVITNMRLIGTQLMPIKVAWQAPRGEIASTAGDSAKKSLTVTRANGENFTFKKVPTEDHAMIIGLLSAEGAPLSVSEPGSSAEGDVVAVVEPASAEQKDGAFAKFGAAVRQKAAEVQADWQEKQAQEADAQEAAKAAAGEVVHKGSYGLTVVWVYSGGYVRVDDSALTKWQMSDSARYEKLLAVTFTTMTRDKSAGGRALGALASGGLSVFASGERVESFASVATDRKVHKLACTREAGLALEAAGKGVIEASRASVAPHTMVVTQAAGSTVAEQLRQFADLHKDGILSDEEFAAAKAKLLGVE